MARVVDVVLDKVSVKIERLSFRNLMRQVDVSSKGAGMIGLFVWHLQATFEYAVPGISNVVFGFHVPIPVKKSAQNAQHRFF